MPLPRLNLKAEREMLLRRQKELAAEAERKPKPTLAETVERFSEPTAPAVPAEEWDADAERG